MGMRLMGVYLIGVHLMGVYLMTMYLMRKSHKLMPYSIRRQNVIPRLTYGRLQGGTYF